MLRQGVNYADSTKETGMSTATISRVNRCLEYGDGGYSMILDRISSKEAKK